MKAFSNSRFVLKMAAAFAIAAALVCSGFGVQFAMASPEGQTVVISASDFQGGTDDESVKNVTQIIQSMKRNGVTEPDGLVFAGDFNKYMVDAEESNASIAAFKSTINAEYPSIGDNMALAAGNHERQMSLGINVSPYGNNDTAAYGVFVIHEDNFPWNGQDSPGDAKPVAKQTATDLMGYLNQKIKDDYTKPIFVLCHVPLNANSRADGVEGKYSEYLVNVLNKGAAAGLNIVFLYGHCHDGTSEEFHGGEAVYHGPGDEIEILDTEGGWSNLTKVPRVIGFHYMNAGYTGYYSGKTDALTMCSFAFTDTEMTITRYNKNGLYLLKAAGTDAKYANTVASPHTVQLNQAIDKTKLITKVEESDIVVGNVTLDHSSLTMEPGDVEQLTATALPAAAADKTLIWSSSDSSVVEVDNGRLTAVAPGTVTITAGAASGAEATCTVKVLSPSEAVRVTGVKLDKTSLELFEGDTQTLAATLTPANPTKTRVKWGTSDESVATVDESGHVLCTGVGQAVITVTTVDGGYTATCSVKVKPTSATGITLDKSELSLAKESSSVLVAAVQPAGATNKTVIWNSSDESVAKVSAAGEVTGVGDGAAIVTATTQDGGFVASCLVTVQTKGVYVYPADLVIPLGQSFQYSAEIWPKGSSASVQYHCYYGGKVDENSGLFEATIERAQAEIHVNTTDWKFQGAANGPVKAEIATESSIGWNIADGVLTVSSDVPDYSTASAAPWAKYASKVTSIVVGENVKSVGAQAFSSCTNVTEITVSESVKIDAAALDGLDGIKVNGVPAIDCSTAGHALVHHDAQAATCIEDGWNAYDTCENCDYTTFEKVAAIGHKEAAVPAVAPTCTEDGLAEGKKCSVCGEVLKAQETVAVLGHDLVHHAAKAATTTEVGWKAYDTCKRCSYSTYKELPKIVKPDSESATKPSAPEKIEPETPRPSASQQEAAANDEAVAAGFVGTQATVAKAIANSASDEGPRGTTFSRLRAKATKATKKSVKLKWTKTSGAAKYLVYGNKCGKGMQYKYITSTKKLSLTQKGLKKKTSYKFMVVAVDSKGRVIAVSKTIHAITKGGKKVNATKVRTAAKKNKVTLKKGKKFKLKAKAVATAGKSVMKSHRPIKYESTNTRVAKVTSKGVIKAKGKGRCYVYAYAQNGVYAKIRVKVK